jgi:hypothetical protein
VVVLDCAPACPLGVVDTPAVPEPVGAAVPAVSAFGALDLALLLQPTATGHSMAATSQTPRRLLGDGSLAQFT